MYLLECVFFAMTCTLKRGVTHVGNFHYWALLTLSRDHYFRYKECTRGRRSLEAAFRRKLGCGFGYSFVPSVKNQEKWTHWEFLNLLIE